MPRSGRRILARVAVGLVLGLATTLGVAWGAALSARAWTTSEAPRYRFEPGRVWFVQAHDGAAVTRLLVAPGGDVITPAFVAEESIATDRDLTGDVRALARACGATGREALLGWRVGWPMRALSCVQYAWRLTEHHTRLPAPRAPLAEGGVVLLSRGEAWAVLPLRPLAGGLVVDTLRYGAVWMGMMWGVGGVVRWRRGARGWCRACGYDLGGRGGTCPECGGRGRSDRLGCDLEVGPREGGGGVGAVRHRSPDRRES